MNKKTNLQKNYSINERAYQLILPLDVEYVIPADDSVRLVNKIVDKMDLTSLYETYRRTDKDQVKRMLKISIYANMNGIYSSREIEKLCKRDINFFYLSEQKKAPDHSTIARFQNEHFAPCCEQLLSEQVDFLKENKEISGENIFIDGTKIESAANKYSFVWKRAVLKHREKILEKAQQLIKESRRNFAIDFEYHGVLGLKVLKKYRKRLYAIKKQKNIVFVHGVGKRKTQVQKNIEELEHYIHKLKEYIQKIHLCGLRNSYSKTEIDATFMRMKDDAMKNGQLKPAYNVQHGVDSEYITWLSVSEKPADTPTLIPFLESMKDTLSFRYKNVIADAGYESEENYVYLEKNNQVSYIKPSNYEISKKRSYKKDIGRVEHMEYDEGSDSYTCKNNKKLEYMYEKSEKTRSGYQRKTSVYSCKECFGCEMKEMCIKNGQEKYNLEQRNKNLYISKTFQRCRRENLKRITCESGCMLRMNRSIQVEGSFGVIKQDMGFKRFLCKGKTKVKAECFLVAIAFNINKLHNKIQSERMQSHLFKLKTA